MEEIKVEEKVDVPVVNLNDEDQNCAQRVRDTGINRAIQEIEIPGTTIVRTKE